MTTTVDPTPAGTWPRRPTLLVCLHPIATIALLALVVVLGGCSARDWSPRDARRCRDCQPVRCTHCRHIRFAAPDGTTLGGVLWTATLARPPGGPAVVLSNEYDAGQAGWGALPEHLRRHGYTVLTYDWRGLGASAGRFDPTKAAEDLHAAVAYLRQARPTRLVLVGASLGAMVTATQATALHPVAIGLLSPARSFAGVTVSDQVLRRLACPSCWSPPSRTRPPSRPAASSGPPRCPSRCWTTRAMATAPRSSTARAAPTSSPSSTPGLAATLPSPGPDLHAPPRPRSSPARPQGPFFSRIAQDRRGRNTGPTNTSCHRFRPTHSPDHHQPDKPALCRGPAFPGPIALPSYHPSPTHDSKIMTWAGGSAVGRGAGGRCRRDSRPGRRCRRVWRTRWGRLVDGAATTHEAISTPAVPMSKANAHGRGSRGRAAGARQSPTASARTISSAVSTRANPYRRVISSCSCTAGSLVAVTSLPTTT
jgi:pimeloyl-ACP methyl ester carboxylesterase